ncbi:hypothetical protein ACNREK_13855, partial [Ralstonia pseudosolanacearum]
AKVMYLLEDRPESRRWIHRYGLDLERAIHQVGPPPLPSSPATRTTALRRQPKKNQTQHKAHARADI